MPTRMPPHPRCSKQILRRVQQNDSTLTRLGIGDGYGYESTDQYDYSRLGAAIAKNTHIRHLYDMARVALEITDNRFFVGLEHNSSICKLDLLCNNYCLAGWRYSETLMACQANNNLTSLKIGDAALQHGGDRLINSTLRACTNLESITLNNCAIITDELFVPMVEAMRGIRSLEELDLNHNIIGDVGSQALVTLLEDPSSNLHSLYLQDNVIDADGAYLIANSLAGNSKLLVLFLLVTYSRRWMQVFILPFPRHYATHQVLIV